MSGNNLKPLYERKTDAPVFSYEYYCTATGWDCKRATQHFQEFRDFVKDLSENQIDKVFLHGEENLCAEAPVCPVWGLWVKANQNEK